MIFLDTNIFVYAADETDAVKYDRACAIVQRAIMGQGFVISAQVVNEFAYVLLRKLKKTPDEVRDLLDVIAAVETIAVRPEWAREALALMERHKLQFYDSLLLVAAKTHSCTEFWSEDLNDGQDYGGIIAVNPFKATPTAIAGARNLCYNSNLNLEREDRHETHPCISCCSCAWLRAGWLCR